MEVRFHLAAFRTTTASIAAQKLLRGEGITIAVMPTPRTLQASCGLSVRFAPEDSQRVGCLLSGKLDQEDYALYTAVRTEEGQNLFLALDTNTESSK